jgi:uncharacterized protein DUF664
VDTAELLVDAFGRIREMVHDAVDGLTPSDLAYRPDPDANSIAWLVWHLTRVQDDHVADVADVEQVWTAQRWADRFGLPLATRAIGYGHSSDEVGLVQATGDDLLGYYDAVHDETVRFVSGIRDADLDRIVDEAWDPPVTLGVRLVSVVNDDTAHVGQAAYVRGLLERRADFSPLAD